MSEHILVVGAGLAGLSAAMHAIGSGRRVTVLEAQDEVGGAAGVWATPDSVFDTGPTVLTMPDILASVFAAAGAEMDDHLSLRQIEPAYRGYFPDGSTLDVLTDVDAMADQIANKISPAEARGYLGYVDYVSALYRHEISSFIDRNLDSPLDLLRPDLLALLRMGAFRSLDAKAAQFLRDPRTRRLFTFQALYAGVAPTRARAIYGVISYMDAVNGVFLPDGGMAAIPAAMASVIEQRGGVIQLGTRVTGVQRNAAGAAIAVRTDDGQRLPADAVILAGDRSRMARLLADGRSDLRPLRYSPSAYVLLAESTAQYRNIAHHNIHFGRSWAQTFAELESGQVMSDPSLLVTHQNHPAPGSAPAAGPQRYYVLFPAPNVRAGPVRDDYLGIMLDELEHRGYRGFSDSIMAHRLTTPGGWLMQGYPAGTPFSAAHSFFQSGPFRPGNCAGRNIAFAGAGTVPGVGIPMVLLSGRLATERLLSPR